MDDVLWRSQVCRGPDSDDDPYTVTVLSFAGNTETFEIPAHQCVQDLKEQIQSRLGVPETDQVLLFGTRKLRARERLSRVFGLFCDYDVPVTLVVTPPACHRCKLRRGLWGRRAVLMFPCSLCRDTFYCSKECRAADMLSHPCVCGRKNCSAVSY